MSETTIEYTVAEYTDAPSGIRYREVLEIHPEGSTPATRVAIYAVGNCRRLYDYRDWRRNRVTHRSDYLAALLLARHHGGRWTSHLTADYRERFHVAGRHTLELCFDGEVVAVRERDGSIRVMPGVMQPVYDAAISACYSGLTPGGTSSMATEAGRSMAKS